MFCKCRVFNEILILINLDSFVWAMTTLVFNRSLINIQKIESIHHDLALSGRAPTPFGIEIGSLNNLEEPELLVEQSPYLQWSREGGDAYFLDTEYLTKAPMIISIDKGKFTF